MDARPFACAGSARPSAPSSPSIMSTSTSHDGEFLTLLGPSGSGKTTVLRMIAGFELPTDGQVELGGVDVTTRPPFDRDVNTVFQDYALFPHMSVQDNVEYGLRVRKVDRSGASHVGPTEALESVRLERLRQAPARASCPAASGSASPWREPWSTAPRCCCSTSRSARST